MSWDKLENGILLATAELAGFEAMITCDKNLSYQQNLRDRKLALIVLSTNSWRILSRNPQQVLHAIDSCLPGSFVYLTMRPQ